MKKRILPCLLLAAVLLAGCCFAAAEGNALVSRFYTVGGETAEGPDFEYELLPDGTARIVYCGNVRSELAIPETVDGFPVSELGERSVPEGFGALKVTIPDCVTVIRPNAFGNVHCPVRFDVAETHPTLKVTDGVLICPAEKRIIRGDIRGEYRIPEGIETIDDHAFSGGAARSIYIPESVTNLGRNPFAFCNGNADTYSLLQEVTLSPDNTALVIRDGVLFSRADRRLVWCFSWDEPVKNPEYVIPDETEIIDDYAFSRWGRLESVTVPASVTQVGANPFYGAQNPEGIRLADGNRTLIIIDGMLISRPDRRVVSGFYFENSVSIPEGTEIIGDYAFVSSFSLINKTVTLPDSVKEIGFRAFSGLDTTDVRIPAGVRKIGDLAFYHCGVKELPVFNGEVVIGEYAFSECMFSSLAIRGRAVLRYGAFGSCMSLEKISVAGDARIGRGAFSTCIHLQTAELGEGVKELGNDAFRNCERLEEISLPASLTRIGEGALLNGGERQYNEMYDTFVMIYRSTMHATVPRGSYAEQYCIDNEVNYTAR